MNSRGEVLNTKERRILIGVLAAFAAFGAWLNGFNPTHMSFVCQEDGFVEYSQAFLYLFAGVLFAYVGAHKGFRNIWYWGYALLFLLVAGEEVSWGQRIFNEVTPPALDAINVQHEMNLHNLNGVHQHHHLYAMLVCSTICYAIPLTDRLVPAMRNLYRRFNMPIFPAWMFALPAIGFAFMFGARSHGGADFRLDEMGELYLGFAFFGFALSAYRQASAAFETSTEQQTSPKALAEVAVPPGFAASR
jgi:phosphotransferase system  glucose/maltose/N-acetylglucosamine-specific IIC component